jgi:hypothetical protein
MPTFNKDTLNSTQFIYVDISDDDQPPPAKQPRREIDNIVDDFFELSSTSTTGIPSPATSSTQSQLSPILIPWHQLTQPFMDQFGRREQQQVNDIETDWSPQDQEKYEQYRASELKQDVLRQSAISKKIIVEQYIDLTSDTESEQAAEEWHIIPPPPEFRDIDL